MTRTNVRFLRLAGGLLAGIVVLAGCSGGSEGSTTGSSTTSESSASETAEFNEADVTFAQQMIVHHEGAIEMAQLADGRAQDPRVLDLAGRIEAAQAPEIETMTGWLKDWGQPMSAEETGSMDMGGMKMDVSGLKASSGVEFDRLWLEMMTEHHSSAVDMAETEIADGQNADAVELARQIVESQSAEIEEMATVLSELGS